MKKFLIMLAVFFGISAMFLGCPPAPQPSSNIEVSIDSYMETASGDFELAGWLQNQNGWEAEVPRGYVNMRFSGTPHLETRLIYTILDRDLRQATEEIVINSHGYAQLVASKVFGVDDALLIVGLGLLGYGSVLINNQSIMATDMAIGNSFMFVPYGTNDWAINVPFGPNVLKCQIIQKTSAGDFQYWLYPEAGYDADGDQLPDSWERKYFGGLHKSWGDKTVGCLLNGEAMVWGLHPTLDDFDHDGYTDCEEIFEIGSDPFDFNDPSDVDDYNLSITTQGQGTVTGAGTYAAGTQVTITATPASGWRFDHWTINGTTASNNPGTVTMDSDVVAVAVFTQNTPTNYTLSITTQGQGTTTGAGNYATGTQVTITATPASGWVFDHWTINGTTASNNPGTVTMNGNVAVVAVFIQNSPTSHTLTITTQGQGTVTGAGTYAAGTQVTITATPASGWVFDHWTINGTTASNNPGTVTMNGNMAVVAVFTSNANPGGLINVNLTWNGSVLNFAATNTNPGVIGLELYHQTGSSPWVERQTFTVSSGNASGTVNKFRPNILRFGVVSSTTSGGYIPLETLSVKINGRSIPLVNQDGTPAFQVDVSTL